MVNLFCGHVKTWGAWGAQGGKNIRQRRRGKFTGAGLGRNAPRRCELAQGTGALS